MLHAGCLPGFFGISLYNGAVFQDECFLFFGKETKGLPEDFLEAHRDSCIRLPMNPEARSLNLSNAVAITVYEALRQLNFPHLQKEAPKKPSSAG